MSSKYIYHFFANFNDDKSLDGIVSSNKKILSCADYQQLKKAILVQANDEGQLTPLENIYLSSFSFLHEEVEGDITK